MTPVFAIFFAGNTFTWTVPTDGEIVSARRDGNSNAAISSDPTLDLGALTAVEGIIPADAPWALFWSGQVGVDLPVGRPVRAGDNVFFSADNGCLVTMFFQASAE